MPADRRAAPGSDDIVEGPDGALYISAGPRVSRLSGPGYQTRAVVAEFEADVGGLTVHPDGRLIACIAGRGLAAVDGRGRQSWLNQVEDQPLNCLTSVAATADGNIFVSEGSQLNTAVEWRRDLMQKNRAGRIIVCGPGFERRRSSFATCPILTDWRSRGTRGSCGSPKAGATVSAAPL